MKSESEVAQLCLTLSDPMDCSPPSSSVHGIFQARVLEWGAITFSRGSSQSYWGLSSELTSPWEMWRVKSELLEGRKWLLLSRSWMPVHHVRIHYSFLIPKKITDFCIFRQKRLSGLFSNCNNKEKLPFLCFLAGCYLVTGNLLIFMFLSC